MESNSLPRTVRDLYVHGFEGASSLEYALPFFSRLDRAITAFEHVPGTPYDAHVLGVVSVQACQTSCLPKLSAGDSRFMALVCL